MLSARESKSRNPISQPKLLQPPARNNREDSHPAHVAPEARAGTQGSDRIMAEPVYRRVVIKLSGEYLAGSQSFGIDQPTVDRIAGELIAARQLGVEVAVVVGGGNIVRGGEVSSRAGSPPPADTLPILPPTLTSL